MATTTNFGWETPDDTDLVKDGALAIRTLGNSIDTSLVDLKGGTTGQVLSKTSNTDMDFTWVTSDDSNAIQNAIVDAKGDLIAASAADTPARLAVGNNGETLVADSSTSTGLRWGNNYGFTAGKNKLINSDFRINQRLFTSTTSDTAYGFDRWQMFVAIGSCTYSTQPFTAGTAPVAGYEGVNFARLVTSGFTSTGYAFLSQSIEDVRTFANQTVTISFWAKAASGTPKIGIGAAQRFGSGGSPSAQVNIDFGSVTISTSWARYSVTGTIPSISGKTIGTTANTSNLRIDIWASGEAGYITGLGVQNGTFDIWGVQIEAGSVATAFQTATGTLAGELQAAQRYYYRFTPSAAANRYGAGFCDSTTVAEIYTNFPVQMRTRPTALEQSGTATDYSLRTPAAGVINCSAVPAIGNASEWGATTNFTVASGLTAGNGVLGRAVNTSAYLGWSAEL